MKYQTNSAQETQSLAQKIAQEYKNGVIVALFGNLGAGKTTFAQGFAQGLGIKGKIISPTFTIMRIYDIPGNKEGKFYHIDLYRLENIRSIEDLGISELFDNPQNIILIEWAEKLGELLPLDCVKISIKRIDENQREIAVEKQLFSLTSL